MTLFLALVFFVTSSGVQLAWDANTEPDIAGYNVYRSDGGSEFIRLNADLVQETTYTDESVEPRQTYRYYVTAVNPAGESEPSETVEVNPLQFKLDEIVADISTLQEGTRSLRDQADEIRLAIQAIEDELGNDPKFITRRFVAGNAVRQYEIILSHLNALVRLLGETRGD